MVNTAVLVSGGGANLQAILDSYFFGQIPGCNLSAVISSVPDAYALTRAKNAGIRGFTVDASLFPNEASFNNAIFGKLKDLDTELVVLAGYRHELDRPTLRYFKNRIINIHPSLLPAFSEGSSYGLQVHQKVIEAGVKISGATAYFVTENDFGPIILQQAVAVDMDDTPQTLQRKVMEQAEWPILAQAVTLYCQGRLRVEGNRVRVLSE